ncbi:AEC family transporter [Bacillus marinisedimentorum]|uniref:AEC family transporter n=1 Tax=Bacillus marinisedimentorum TaxID=1821260 RepID=UPI000872C3BA|nr:AEC family transporter [Bacillus marinisedimentorum]
MTIFIEVVLPVLLIFAAAFGLQKWKRIDIRSVSTVAIYILTPALVFPTFYKADLNRDYLNMVIFALILLAVILIIVTVYSKIMRYSESVESGLILSTAFMNAGNFGSPIILFAYGQRGFDYSVSFLVLQAIIMNFFGIYYAARGGAGVKLALKTVMQMPPTYATIIALIMNVFDIGMPANIMSAIELVAKAAIPMVMLILGMQLAEIQLKNLQWSKITFGTITRLFLSPVIAYIIIQFFPMDPLLEKVLIVSAAMPSAATTTMFAVQYDSEPDLVSSITLITTLVSIVTITLLLGIMG